MGPNNAIGDARSQNIPSSSKGIRGFNRIQGQFLRRILLISFAAIDGMPRPPLRAWRMPPKPCGLSLFRAGTLG